MDLHYTPPSDGLETLQFDCSIRTANFVALGDRNYQTDGASVIFSECDKTDKRKRSRSGANRRTCIATKNSSMHTRDIYNGTEV